MGKNRAIDWVGLAKSGHAPSDGCSELGVGYDDAFETLLTRYVDGRFPQGRSSEKFVVGPFGSGKTHFLRQLLEMARRRSCVTSEVKLNKDIDFTKRLVVYQEIARRITAPDQPDHGLGGLLRAIHRRVRKQAPSVELATTFFDAWTDGIAAADFELDAFARVAQLAMRALENSDEALFLAAERWLSGEIHDRALAKVVSASTVPSEQQGKFAAHMLLSLFQLVRYSGYTGTVVGLDEAEQGFDVDRKRLDRILSMLQSDINSIADLEGGSALIVYALTPDIRDEMDRFPALQQRIADPGGVPFLDGNWLATVIDLTFRGDPADHLKGMAARLVELYASSEPLPAGETLQTAQQRVEAIALDVATTEPSSSARRILVKRTCAYLLGVPVAPDQLATPEF